jgi:hypothetical protein
MLNRKGQNIAEYSILIALTIAAAMAMQTYVKRGIQGRVADAVDHAPDTDLVAGKAIKFTTRQYEPYYLESEGDIASKRDYKDKISERGKVARSDVIEETKRKKGAWEETKWDASFADPDR